MGLPLENLCCVSGKFCTENPLGILSGRKLVLESVILAVGVLGNFCGFEYEEVLMVQNYKTVIEQATATALVQNWKRWPEGATSSTTTSSTSSSSSSRCYDSERTWSLLLVLLLVLVMLQASRNSY